MPFTVGPDGTITVPVEGEVTGEDELAAQIAKAFQQALKDPKILAAFQTTIKGVIKAFQGISKSTDKEFRNIQRQGERAARNIAAAFRDVGKATAAAMKTPTTNPSLHALETSIHGIATSMEQLQDATREQIRLLEILMRGQTAATRARSQADRDAVLKSTQSARQQIVDSQAAQNAARNAALLQSASIRAVSREAIQRSRAMVRVFELTWKSAERFVRAFARGASAVLRGFGRTVQSIFRGIGRTIATSVRGMNNVWRGFGRAGISALQSLSRAISNALRRDETATRASLQRRERAFSQSLGRQQAAQMRFQQTQQRSLLGGLGGGGLLAGAAGGAGLFGLLTGGFERAGEQERMQLTFEALLGDADKAKAVLGRLSEYARTTSFDFLQMAETTAALTATMGDLGRAEEITHFLANITALAGGTDEQFGRARLAFEQIASAGRLYGGEIRQLRESLPAIPIVDILTEKFFGGDQDAFGKALNAGELGFITADQFFDAVEEGIAQRFPGIENQAQIMAGTFTGLAQNVRENFDILGAAIINVAEGPIKSAMERLNEFMILATGFITGEMFLPGGEENPFSAMAERNRGAGPGSFLTVPFEELPPEMQDILQERNGWGPGEGFVLAAEHAEQLWDELHPPPEIDETISTLEKVRDVIIDIGKAIIGVLGLSVAFTILRLAFVGLTSPLGLILISTSLISGFFSLMYENSIPLQEALSGLKESLGNLGDTIGGILGRAGENISEALFGSPDLWGNLGDQMAKVVTALDNIVQGIDDFLTGNLKPGSILDKIHELIFGPEAGGGTGAVGITPAPTEQRSISEQITEILEGTFLDPIVNFFTGPFANIAETIGGGVADFGNLLGDIFDVIFGSATTAGGGTGAVGITPSPGASGIGSQILDILEDTFIGPIVRFFRDPFANIVERIGGGVADFGGFLNDMFNAIFGGIGAGGGTGAVGITPAPGPGQGIGGRILDVLESTFLQPVVSFFRDFAERVREEGVGGAFGNIGSRILDAFGNIWSGESGEGGLKAVLKGLWRNISNWFEDTFTADNIKTVATAALSGIETAGREIGKIIGDPLFAGIVAGTAAAIVAAIALILFNFTSGLIEGISENADQWGEIIGDGISTAMEWITTEGPGVITKAIITMISDPGIGLALFGAGLLLGTSTGRGLISGVVTFFRNRTETGKLRKAVADGMKGAGLGSAVTTGLNQAPTPPAPITFFSKVRTSLTAGLTWAKEKLKAIGRDIGIAIMGGLAAFETGNIAGRVSGGRGSFLLALLGGGAAGATAGSFIAPGVGTAIGAGLGVALAGIGFAIGKTGREAEEAAAKIDRYSQALRGITDPAGQTAAGAAAVIDGLTEAFEGNASAFEILERTGFDPAAFFAAMREGGSMSLDPILELFDGLARLPEVTDLGPQVLGDIERLQELMATEFVVLPDSLGQINHELERLRDNGTITDDTFESMTSSIEAMTQAGVPLDEILKVLFEEGGSVLTATNLERIRQGLEDNIPAGEAAADALDTVAEASERIKTELEGGATAKQIGEILSQSDLTTTDAMAALRAVAEELAEKVDQARQAVVDFVTQDVGPTDVGLRIAQFTLDVDRIGDNIKANLDSDEMNQVLKDAANTVELGQFTALLKENYSTALAQGMSADPETFRVWKQGLIAQIGAVVTDPETAALMIAEVEKLQPPDAELLENLRVAEMSSAKIQEITDIVAAGVQQALFNVDMDAMQAVVVTGAGGGGEVGGGAGGFDLGGPGIGNRFIADIVTAIGAGAPDFKTAVETELPPAGDEGIVAAKSVIEASGKKYVGSVAEGIVGGAGQAVAAARVVAFVATLSLYAFENAAYQAGLNISNAFARGVRDAGRAAVVAATAMALSVVNITRNILAISSPSKVFYDIGKQVGQGFIEGIKEVEGDMAEAIGAGLERAIKVGTQRAAAAVERAGAAEGIFNLLQPSILPGGTSLTEIRQSQINLRQALGEFRTGIREQLAGAFGETPQWAQLTNAFREIQGIAFNVSQSFAGVREDVAAAREHQAEITQFWSSTAAERERLGLSRPAPLSRTEQNLLRYGAVNLDPRNTLGAQNISTITQALESLREYASTAISVGRPLNEVITNTARYRDQLLSTARAYGFNAAQLNALVAQYGLTTKQMYDMARNLFSLNQGTAQGATNVAQFLEAAQAIRDFGAEMFAAGANTTSVVAQLRQYRNQLINSGVAAGFNRAALTKLINEIGLSDSALSNFIRQLQAFDAEAKKAAATAKKAAAEAAAREAEEKRKEAEREAEQGRQDTREGNLPLPRVQELHVHIPSGDPEAVALVTANRLAYNDLTAW